MPASLAQSRRRPFSSPNDGTRQLLQWGGSMVAAGLLAALLLLTVLGGYTRLGATTNAGWFALIVALMCLPFGGAAARARPRQVAQKQARIERQVLGSTIYVPFWRLAGWLFLVEKATRRLRSA